MEGLKLKNENEILFIDSSSFLIWGCRVDKEKVGEKFSEEDEKIIKETYKDFDSSMTMEKYETFKWIVDSTRKWRDSKIKRKPF